MRSIPEKWKWPVVGLGMSLVLPLLGAGSCVREDFRGRVGRVDTTTSTLRVAVVRDAPSVEIRVTGAYEVWGTEPEKSVLEEKAERKVTVRVRNGAILWGDHSLGVASIRVIPRPSGSVHVDGRGYRGRIRVDAAGKGSLIVVNEIGVETYLAGVLGAEMPLGWPDEALQAQAIAARTYALDRAHRRRHEPYDLTADTSSQVYKGLDAEDPTAYRVVYETQGVVLTHRGKVFTPYFMSTCGGRTASAAKVFGGEAPPPLGGVECGYCRASGRYRWPVEGKKVSFTQAELAGALRPRGLSFDRIDRIESIGKDPDGYATRVSLHSGGQTFTLSALDFRMALGPNNLLSTNFEAERKGETFVFRGRGWGHGVGMCQWGAYGMAKAGYDARTILRHYYPGAELVRVKG